MARFSGGVMNWSPEDVLFAAQNQHAPQTDPNEWAAAVGEAKRRGLKFDLAAPSAPTTPATVTPGEPGKGPYTGPPIYFEGPKGNPPPQQIGGSEPAPPLTPWTPQTQPAVTGQPGYTGPAYGGNDVERTRLYTSALAPSDTRIVINPPGSEPPPATSTAPSSSVQPSPTPEYLQSLLASGMSPQQAAAEFNRATGRTTGNEAVFYGPEAHNGTATIGLPDFYLANVGGQWQLTRRGSAAPAPATQTQAAPSPQAQPAPSANRLKAVTQKIDANLTGDVNQAVDYLNKVAQTSYGRTLTQADLDYAANLVGYQPGQPVTGAMVNRILEEMDRVWGGGTAAGPTPTSTPPPSTPPPTAGPTIPPGTVPPGTRIPPTQTPPAPGNSFSDPNTAYLEEYVRARLKELNGGVEDPALDQLAALLQGRITSLQQPNLPNADRDAMLAYGRKVFGDLQGDPFTQQQLDLIQTQQIDPIERDRTAAKQRVTERLAARGITPDSGLFQSAMNEVDRAFDAERAQAHGQTAMKAIDQSNVNRAQALDLSSFLSGVTDTTNENTQARAREMLTTAGDLSNLTAGVRNETKANRNEGLALASLLASLPERRLALAQSVVNGTAPPTDLFNSFANLLGVQNQGAYQNRALNLTADQYKDQRNAQFMQGLGALARLFSASGSGSGGNGLPGYSSGPF